MTTLFLIGAARSGTKMLRDLLGEHPRVGVVPYDVNYLWRLGSDLSASDELQAPLDPRAKRLLQKELEKAGGVVQVEKTVSNCLRVPMIATEFPDARFVFLVRDPVDVTESAMRQWTEPTDWKYSAKKALAYPWLSAPTYALDHVKRALKRSDDSSLQSWGPRYEGLEAHMRELPPHLVCAHQWAQCNSAAVHGFEVSGAAVFPVRYEALVTDPLVTLRGVAEFSGIEPHQSLKATVRRTEVGKGARAFTAEEAKAISAIVSPVSARIDSWIGRAET